MITADHWHNNGDGTAWLVTDHGQRPNVWSSVWYWSDVDRPCDTCGGKAIEYRAWPYPCDCIDGRHTFDVEVLDTIQDHVVAVNKRRVSVVPGMVLPIHEPDASWAGSLPAITRQPDGWWYRPLRLGESPEPVTLPPAAAPGMWVVKVKVAS